MKKFDHICQYTGSNRFEINMWNMRFCQNNKTWKYDICALKRCKSECMQQKSKFFPTFRWRWFPYLQWRQCPPCWIWRWNVVFYAEKGWAKSVVCQNFLFSSEDCFWSYWTIVILRPLNIETCQNSVVTDGFHTKLNFE